MDPSNLSPEAAVAVLLVKNQSIDERLEWLSKEMSEIKDIVLEVRLIQERFGNLTEKVVMLDSDVRKVKSDQSSTTELINKGKGAAWATKAIWSVFGTSIIAIFFTFTNRINELPTRKELHEKEAVLIKRIEVLEHELRSQPVPTKPIGDDYKLNIYNGAPR